MKVLGVIGIIISVIALTVGLHLHFIYAKAVDLIDAEITAMIEKEGLTFLESAQYKQMFEIKDFETTYGMLVMLLGALSILLCLFPALKKFKVSWAGVFFGLVTFFIGAAYGTHMFS